jgi:hypothetical protein
VLTVNFEFQSTFSFLPSRNVKVYSEEHLPKKA